MIVIFPTETVYGIGATFDDLEGIDKIYTLKRRDRSKPLLLHVSPAFDFRKVIDEEEYERVKEKLDRIVENFWPGPVSVVVKAKRELTQKYEMLKSGFIGIRCPDMLPLWEFIDWAGPVWGTSLNKSGEKEVTSWEDIPAEFAAAADVIIVSKCSYNVPSTVIKITSEGVEVIREGAVKVDVVKAVLSR